jgi:SNF2 family DNA or RNA helicase
MVAGQQRALPADGAAATDQPLSEEEAARKKAADTQVALRGVLEALGQSQEMDDMDECQLPWGQLSVPLLRHQRQAVSWMKSREDAASSCGGLLADDQGLGKTVTTIALMLLEPSRTVEERLSALKASRQKAAEAGAAAGGGQVLHGGHLIVCPTSVLRQWARELRDKVSPANALSVLVHHGPDRAKNPLELLKYDVIITTYSILAMDLPRTAEAEAAAEAAVAAAVAAAAAASGNPTVSGGSGSVGSAGAGGVPPAPIRSQGLPVKAAPKVGPMFRIHWFRVVLDEAQTIKNHRTQTARAAWALKSTRRWCLSGTPMQNSVDDLFSYFRFLKQEPYSEYPSFRSLIRDPILKTPDLGFKRLQTILQVVMLRRTKTSKLNGKPIVSLPPRIVELEVGEFSQAEREFYDNLKRSVQSELNSMSAEGSLGSNYVNILWMLLRLRQCCNHPHLVKNNKKAVAAKDVPAADLAAAKTLTPVRPLLTRAALFVSLRSPERVACVCVRVGGARAAAGGRGQQPAGVPAVQRPAGGARGELLRARVLPQLRHAAAHQRQRPAQPVRRLRRGAVRRGLLVRGGVACGGGGEFTRTIPQVDPRVETSTTRFVHQARQKSTRLLGRVP